MGTEDERGREWAWQAPKPAPGLGRRCSTSAGPAVILPGTGDPRCYHKSVRLVFDMANSPFFLRFPQVPLPAHYLCLRQAAKQSAE